MSSDKAVVYSVIQRVSRTEHAPMRGCGDGVEAEDPV